VVEHQRLAEQRLSEHQRAPRIARQQDSLGQLRGGAQMDRLLLVGHHARL
jgi:hypothetical protein